MREIKGQKTVTNKYKSQILIFLYHIAHGSTLRELRDKSGYLKSIIKRYLKNISEEFMKIPPKYIYSLDNTELISLEAEMNRVAPFPKTIL